MMKKMILVQSVVLSMVLAACGSATQAEPSAQASSNAAPAAQSTQAQQHNQAVIDTDYGKIVVQLDAQKAPQTVANFKAYAEQGFYNGTIFHRVIDGFMIQGGGFTAEMQEKPTAAPIANEADNGLTNDIGTIAMARTADPHSASSQFFINVADNDFLNHTSKTRQGYGYAVFGKVVSGMEVVNKIAKVRTRDHMGHQNVPVEPVRIRSLTVSTAPQQ
ncbi:peptidylprolyl isomerase [Conchiformibius steedae]|uniref:peptidylprolyl isomerase n=1 Tax=Conchiformibius steedae TaxID=153493 RepID=UPI0026F0B57E|nr:peptidylprolyl isomerase [Conchiformibius steedae]